jgi:hypothetical protein
MHEEGVREHGWFRKFRGSLKNPAVARSAK